MTALFPVSASADIIDVSIQNFAFVPQTLTIKAGDTVRWANLDTVGHTSTSDTGVWASNLLFKDDTFEFTFTQAAAYPYHCAPHSTMKGTIIVEEPALSSDVATVTEGQGGQVNFFLDAGPANGNRIYLMLGSITGSVPGTPLPGGTAVLPINWDVFTGLVVSLLNTPIFSNFQGSLDVSGKGTAALNLGPLPGAAGLIMTFAYAVAPPWNFASNTVGITVVP
jgi:plastocyanin